MDRLAEMDEYDGMFGRRLVDDDFLAAGYTPQEVQAYRGAIVQPSLTAQDRAAIEAQYGTLEAPDLTLRQRGAARVQDRLILEGIDPYVAGSYSRRIVGDTAPTDGGLGIGLADLTPLGMVFGTQEGARTAVQGYQQGDPVQMGLGALEAGLGILEATPLTAAIGRGIAATARRMDPNTLYSVFGPPVGRSEAGRALVEPKVEVLGSAYGQTDARLTVPGVEGRIDYSIFEGRPKINMIEVPEAARRQGNATKLLEALQNQFPDVEIDWGSLTEQGAALYRSTPFREAPSEYAASFDELNAARQRFRSIQSQWEDMSAQGKSAPAGFMDEWNDLQDQIDFLENQLRLERPSVRLIETQ